VRNESERVGGEPLHAEDDRGNDLEALHVEIDACRVCSSFLSPLEKPTGLVRGGVASIVIVGQAPGNQELARRRAFAGMSGRRLEEWLVACGAPAANPRSPFYFTSVIKCICPESRHLSQMARNCQPFLHRQLAIIRPALVISLGAVSFENLNFTSLDYSGALCQTLATTDHLLFPPFGEHFTLLVWPHPSGLNRWLNDSSNAAALTASFDVVRRFLVAGIP
jgi:DNA polymerase